MGAIIRNGTLYSGSGGSNESIVIDSELSETSENPVQNKVITEKLNEVFQFVSNGKKLLASAITDIGMEITPDATFEEIAEVIRSIVNKEIEEYRSKTFSTQEEASEYIFASSYWDDSRKPFVAFDGKIDTGWATRNLSDMNGEYIGYNFKEKTLISKMYLEIFVDNDNISFVIQGCEDTEITENSIWEDLSEIIELPYNRNIASYIYSIKSNKSYSAYRMLFKSGQQLWNTGISLSELFFLGYKIKK